MAGHLDCSGIPMNGNDGGQRQPTASGRSGTTSLLLSLSVHVHHLHRRDFGPIPPASWVTGMFIVFGAFSRDGAARRHLGPLAIGTTLREAARTKEASAGRSDLYASDRDVPTRLLASPPGLASLVANRNFASPIDRRQYECALRLSPSLGGHPT